MGKAENGRFVWHELLTTDLKAAIAFYGEVTGWKSQPFGDDYVMWVGSQGPLGGVMTLPEAAAKMGAPPHWIGNVADVDVTTALAHKLGGKVYREPWDVPTVGRVAVIADPQGAPLSVFTPTNAMEIHDASREGEFCWNELSTTDSAAAFAFYSELFGWKVQEEMDMGAMGTYRIFGTGDTRLGGMMTSPPGGPTAPMWTYYTETSDLDAALARSTRNGAKIVSGPMVVPGGGRIAQLSDPQGVVFALHQAPKV
jgi:uncharacterized protein